MRIDYLIAVKEDTLLDMVSCMKDSVGLVHQVGTVGQRDGDMEGRRDRGTEGWRHGGTEGQRSGGADERRNGGTDGDFKNWRAELLQE